jgi:hypothetical protein
MHQTGREHVVRLVILAPRPKAIMIVCHIGDSFPHPKQIKLCPVMVPKAENP